MRTLVARRIPIAWFLLALIVIPAAGIVWLIATKAATPGNAVLIHDAAASEATSQALLQESYTPSPAVVPKATSALPPTPQALVVYVSGEVVSPGVYTLPLGSRVADAVAASGGFTDLANREVINLAARVSDEQHIRIPGIGETVEAAGTPTQEGPNAADGDSGDSENLTPGPTAPSRPANKININTATAKELETLPGIGEVLAQRIVTDREANGPFLAVDDLMRVPGIKEGLMSQLRDLVSVGP